MISERAGEYLVKLAKDTIKYYLDNGKIMACGNHNELLENSQIYREIYEAQTKSKASEKTEGGEA